MPVRKCSNGKYRIGDGECMYKSKASADRAYKGYLGSKYMTKKIDEKVELKAAKQKDETDEMHSSDLKSMMRLAGIEKDIKSEDKKSVDFIGALSKGQVSETIPSGRFATFRMLEEELQNKNVDDSEVKKNVSEDENSLATLQYNIGDEVETPFGHGVIQDVCDNGKCLVKHTDPKDEHGDAVEVSMDSMHRITEANLSGNIQYFKVDEAGSEAIKRSPLANEIKYSDDDGVMAISTDRMDEINDIVNAAGGSLMIKEAMWDAEAAWMEPPEYPEPNDAEIEQAIDSAKQATDEFIHDDDDYMSRVLNEPDLDPEDKAGYLYDFYNDAVHLGKMAYESDLEHYNEDGDALSEFGEYATERFIELGFVNSEEELKAILATVKTNKTTEEMDLSKGSYDRSVIEMIADEMRLGKNPAQIAEELSFDEAEVSIVCETILNLKKKLVIHN